jgi:methylase of polypeptide subunit release factors
VTQNAANPGSPLSDAGTVDRLGADLRAAGYDSDGVPAVLGMGAHRALGRGELAPALRATRDRSPLATLTRLFLLGSVEDEVAVGRALPRTGIAEAIDQGVLERSGGAIRAALDIRPYSADAQEFLLVSDLDSDTRPGPVRRDHVLGIGAASVTLARAVIREPVDRALDVGTGSGVQALHLASHAREVIATDVNPRALALAAATARLNGQHWDLRAGSMYEPVAGEDFDLIVCNPPFVIGDGEMRYSYRDSGVAGDGICRALVEGVRTHLRPGGTAQLLANWIVREGADWRDRVGSWVQASGCDAWVVQRELADPAEYVGLWLTDAGEDGKATGADPAAATALAENWLDYLATEHVQGIGMGLITLRRTDSATASVTLDEVTGPDEEVTGQEAAGFLRRRGWVERATDADLLASRLVLSGQVILERRSLAGDDGWTTVLRMVRRPGGPGATLELDEWGQALLAGCRGAAPLRLLIELLAAANGLNTDALADAALPAVRAAVIRGLLEPVTA